MMSLQLARRATSLVVAASASACSYEYIIEPGSTGATGSTSAATTGSSNATTDAATAQGSGSQGSGGGGGSGGAGDGGGANTGVGGGGGEPCDTAATCDAPNDPCLEAVCDAGRCSVAPVPAGPIEGQEPFDCLILRCDGAGQLEELADDDPPPDAPCAAYTCDQGEIVVDLADSGEPCGEGGLLECDGAGNCAGCVLDEDCGADTECATPNCGDDGICDPGFESASLVLPDVNPNCTRRRCDGAGGVVTENDTSDVISDGQPCTTDTCVNMAPVHTPVSVGMSPLGCTGVCQGAPFAGQCGMRVYSRSFPAAGAWSSSPVSAAFGGVVPPTGILSAEMNSNGTRLFVWRSNGLVYERTNGSWAAGVATATRFPNLVEPAFISSSIMENFGDPEDLLIITTSHAPPQQYTFHVPNVGAADWLGGPEGVTPDAVTQQESVTLDWAFAEAIPVTPGGDYVRVWKSLDDTLYEQHTPATFDYVSIADESACQLDLGVSGAPLPYTIVAAYYDRPNARVYVVAP